MRTADLYWKGVRQYRQVPTGKMVKTTRGTLKPETVGEEFVETVGGEQMGLAQWYEQMREAVTEEGLQEIFEEIKMSCRRLAWLKNETQVEEYALECLSLRQQLEVRR